MSEFPQLNHNVTTDPPRPELLPGLADHFLNLDPRQQGIIAESAAKPRTMADLRAGNGPMNSDFGVSNTLADGAAFDARSGDERQPFRGGTLAHMLLCDGLGGSAPGALLRLGQPGPYGEAYSRLHDARRAALVRNETWTADNERACRELVDEVLGKAGLTEAVTAAVRGLTGPELEGENQTDLESAKYGAALVALSVGAAAGTRGSHPIDLMGRP